MLVSLCYPSQRHIPIYGSTAPPPPPPPHGGYKTISKLNFSLLNIERKFRNKKFNNYPSWFTFFTQRGSFHVIVLQRRAKKCGKNYNAGVQPLIVLTTRNKLNDLRISRDSKVKCNVLGVVTGTPFCVAEELVSGQRFCDITVGVGIRN